MSDSLTVWEFLHHRMVSVVIILLASLSQGAASQLSSHVLTVAGIRTRNALQVNIICPPGEDQNNYLSIMSHWQVCIYDKALQLSIGSRNNKGILSAKLKI